MKIYDGDYPTFYHRFRAFGVASLWLMAMAIATGVMDQLPQGSCYYLTADAMSSLYKSPVSHYSKIPDSCKIANGMVVMVIIGGLITIYVVTIRKSHPSEELNNPGWFV